MQGGGLSRGLRQALEAGPGGMWAHSPRVAQDGGVVQGPSALGVLLVDVGGVLEQELAGDQRALENRHRTRCVKRPVKGVQWSNMTHRNNVFLQAPNNNNKHGKGGSMHILCSNSPVRQIFCVHVQPKYL